MDRVKTRDYAAGKRAVVAIAAGSLFCAISGTTGWIVWKYRVEAFPPLVNQSMPIVAHEPGRICLRMPNGNLVGDVGQYPEELTAYLRFEYLQSLRELSGTGVLMTTRENNGHPQYVLYLVLKNDILSQSDRLASLRMAGYIDSFSLVSPPRSLLEKWKKQTRVFEDAYRIPVTKRLLKLPPKELASAVAQFILFKTKTDKRVRERIEPSQVRAPSENDAREFAADMIDVAAFYDIPLDMLLGIGAMENNYLNVRGDLHHKRWKRRAQPGDEILKRRHGRVLVRDFSVGPWQITRETLRYVHDLYLHDKRNYSELPARLRPSRHLDFDNLDTGVLTTYAGLLLRQLLDSFHGDVAKAEGAYNGGFNQPNMQYSAGVSMVAKYAHQILGVAVKRKNLQIAKSKLRVLTQRMGAHSPLPQASPDRNPYAFIPQSRPYRHPR